MGNRNNKRHQPSTGQLIVSGGRPPTSTPVSTDSKRRVDKFEVWLKIATIIVAIAGLSLGILNRCDQIEVLNESRERGRMQAHEKLLKAWDYIGDVPFGPAVRGYTKRPERIDQAVALLREVRASEPSFDVDCLVLEGAIRYATGYAQDALAVLDKAVQIRPNDPVVHMLRGNALRKLNRRDDAVASYSECLKIDPHNSFCLVNYGQVLLQLRRVEDAIGAFKQSEMSTSTRVDSYVGLGDCYNMQQKPEQAFAAFEQAVSIDLRSAEAHRGCGLTQHELGHHDQAVAELELAVLLDPSNASWLGDLACELEEFDGRLPEALAAYDKSIALDPTSVDVQSNRAGLLHRLGRDNDALGAAMRAVSIDGRNAHAHSTLGCVLGSLSRWKEAYDEDSVAVGLDPANAVWHYNLAISCKKLMKQEESAVEFSRAHKLNPSIPDHE